MKKIVFGTLQGKDMLGDVIQVSFKRFGLMIDD
jgi:hypothetical protein